MAGDETQDGQQGGQPEQEQPGERGQFDTGHAYRSCPCTGAEHTCGG